MQDASTHVDENLFHSLMFCVLSACINNINSEVESKEFGL